MLTDNNHLDKDTIKKTGSIYTPLDIVEKMMAKVEDEFWSDPTKTFCDPTCGTGAIIIPMLDNRVKHGIDPTVALKTMYGNELLTGSYDILMKNLHEWSNNHNVIDTSWKENFYNMDFFDFIKLVDDPDKVPLEDFFEMSNKIKIDLFLMNPPYTDNGCKMFTGGSGTTLASKIMKSLEKHRVVCISGMNAPSALKHKITFIESQGCNAFENAKVFTYIWTMNDNKPKLYKDFHNLKSVKKSKYFFLKLTTTAFPEIKKENKSENNRFYIDVENDEEMKEINEFLKQNYTPYKDWFCGVCKPRWCIANILYNSKWRERFVK